MGRVAGRVAIVTGAARGMGAAHARLLVQEGARVLLTDVLEEEGRRTASKLGAQALFASQDVSRAADWERVVKVAHDAFGDVNVLVNNAGYSFAAPLETTSEEEYRRVIDINQVSIFLGMKAILPSMRRAGGGSIINISSTAGLGADVGAMAYGASKWAVTGMTKIAAKELGPEGIRVNSVHPGVIDTPMIRAQSASAQELIRAASAAIPLGRIGSPEEVSNLVLFLASEESSYINGAAIVIDGGVR